MACCWALPLRSWGEKLGSEGVRTGEAMLPSWLLKLGSAGDLWFPLELWVMGCRGAELLPLTADDECTRLLSAAEVGVDALPDGVPFAEPFVVGALPAFDARPLDAGVPSVASRFRLKRVSVIGRTCEASRCQVGG